MGWLHADWSVTSLITPKALISHETKEGVGGGRTGQLNTDP